MATWCCGIDSTFLCQNLFLISDFPEHSFLHVRLVDVVPEEVINLLHVFARSRSLKLLISAAHAELLSDVFL